MGHDHTRITPPTAVKTKTTRVVYLYTHLWSHEVRRYRTGLRARHHLFGWADLPKHNIDVAILEADGWRERLLTHPRRYQILQALWAALSSSSSRFTHQSALFAVNEGTAYPALALKAIGLVRAPIIVVNVGLLREAHLRGWRNIVWRFLLRQATLVISYTRSQTVPISRYFGVLPRRSVHIPFGVDTDFLSRSSTIAAEHIPSEPYVISVGTNEGKDYPTLLDAVKDMDVTVLIVTDQYNLDKIHEHGAPSNVCCASAIEMTVLREIYRRALFGVIPLGQHLFSSGQTVLLENMAMGKAMIVADVPAIRDYVVDEETALLYPRGDSDALRRQIQRLLDDSALRERIGSRAKESVIACFNSDIYASNLAVAIDRATHS